MKKTILKAIFAFVFLITFSVSAAQISIPVQRDVNVFLVGTGLVGSTFLEQIVQNHEALNEKYGVNIKVVGIANSRTMHFSAEGIQLKDWRLILEKSSTPMSSNNFLVSFHSHP